jgi:hypothetical protein
MTMKTAVCAIAVALLAGTAAFPMPAAAQRAPIPPSHGKRLFLSAVAVYDAGLRRGRANSSNNAYLRGFRDGTSAEAYSSRGYVVNRYAGNPVPLVNRYAVNPIAPVAGYALYDRAAGYAPVIGGYSSYGVRSDSYGDGFSSDRYDAGYGRSGLMDVAVAPVAIAPPAEVRAAHWSYCAARYQSFDPASDTFLSVDGNRYFCR